jgi:hypothetical protein
LMNLCIKKLGFFRVIIFENGLIRYSAIILLHFLMNSYDCEYMLEVQHFLQAIYKVMYDLHKKSYRLRYHLDYL